VGYVCIIADAFSRRIVGWRVAANMKTAARIELRRLNDRLRRS
jgi:transposase InsO family protein